jgi:SAM-dependent methyltransferase
MAGTARLLPALVRESCARWREGRFDRRFGTETGGIVSLGSHRIVGPHAVHGEDYEATDQAMFERMLGHLTIRRDQYVFVDLGAGKGRAVLLAALSGFRRAIGVEFSHELAAAARANVDRVARRRRAAPIEILCEDAAGYRLPDEKLVCYLYNPFDASVLAKVVANIGDSLRACPRDLVLMYRNPKHRAVIDQAGFFRGLVVNSSYGIYSARPEGRAAG